MRTQHHTGCSSWRGSKCQHQNWEIQLKKWQIQLLDRYKYSWNSFWALFWSKKCVDNITLVAPDGEAANANTRIEKYSWKKWQILVQILEVPNFQIGGARQAAVALQPMHVWRVRQLKSGFLYLDHSNNSTLSWVRAMLKAQEASKVKNSCFKGIVHPTDIHGSWGTWLTNDLSLLGLLLPQLEASK